MSVCKSEYATVEGHEYNSDHWYKLSEEYVPSVPSKLLLAFLAFINLTLLSITPIILYRLSSGHGFSVEPKHT